MADKKFEILDGFDSQANSNVNATLTSSQLEVTGNVAVDTDTLIVNSATDRVGINKAVPTTALDVVGTVTATAFSGNGALITNIDVANIPNLTTNFLSSQDADSYESGGILSISNSSTLQVTSGSIKLSDNQTLVFGNGGDAILDFDNSTNDFTISANSVTTRLLGEFIPNRIATSNAIAIGYQAGRSNQDSHGVALGYQAGELNQGTSSVAIGRDAGETDQGDHAIAIGHLAGTTRQGTSAIAMGYYAADTDQGAYGIAMGYATLSNGTQGTAGIAIGRSACSRGQGIGSVAIGSWAGYWGYPDYLAQGAGGVILQGTQSTTASGNMAGSSNLDITVDNHILIRSDETSLSYPGGANTGWTLAILSSNNESTSNSALTIRRSASSGFYNFNPTMLRFQAEDGSTFGPSSGPNYGNTTFVQDVYNGMSIRNEGDPWNLFGGKITLRAGGYSSNTFNDVFAYFSTDNYMPYHASNGGGLYVKGLEMDDSIRTFKFAANSIVLQSGAQYAARDGNFRIHANTSYYGEMYCVSSVGFRIRSLNAPVSIQGDSITDAITLRAPNNDRVLMANCAAYTNSYMLAYWSGSERLRTTSTGVTVTGTLSQTSAFRYKTNIENIVDGSVIDSLRPVSYDLKDGSGENQYGLIAEEVNEVLPSIVGLNTNNEIDNISYTSLIPHMIKKIQELTQEIQELKAGV